MGITEPIYQRNGTWTVQTSQGIKIFSDGESAYDFYLINKHREEKQTNGNASSP